MMAGLMIIPAVFAFSGGDPDTLQAGPSLMFITIPKVFANMGFGTAVGILFFVLVLFAAVTSSIALTESAVSTFEDELGWGRKESNRTDRCDHDRPGNPVLSWDMSAGFCKDHRHAVFGFL